MRSKDPTFLDLSAELNDELDWKAGTLRTFEHHLDITAWAYESLSHLLAIGTSDGIIDIYGGPGVEHRLQVSDGAHVRSLYFASSCFQLICVDIQNRLHIWDLTSPRTPRLLSITNLKHSVNCLALSPSHAHAFIALSNGEIQTFDLLCSRISPYTIPNLWEKYERKVLAGGLQPSTSSSRVPIDIVLHPRNLNLIFIGYAGGVILLDLTQSKSLKAYEFILPPGAPGGGGYRHHALLTERKPELTAIAVHPSGHLLVTGYIDGSLAFWAVEDEDKPLFTMTLDGRHDVNAANAEEMDAALSGAHTGSEDVPEPIFRLAWSGYNNSSDPRGGDTVLAVLGGLGPKDVPGVTAVLLPPFGPPEPPAQAMPGVTLDPSTREAMRQTVIPKNTHCYSTVGVPQDFLLLPREQPHFSGAWDPIAILMLSDAEKDARAIEAYQFPPPLFVPKAEAPKAPIAEKNSEGTEDVLAQEIASALESMQIDEDPRSLELPPALWGGPSSVTGGALISLEREAYVTLVADASPRPIDGIELRGGRAWVEDDEGQMKLMRFQPHRVLATHHTDLSIRFRDLSAQFLVSSDTAPLQTDFPTFMPELTIDLLSVLAASSIASQTSPNLVAEARISSVCLATQSLECAVVLHTGEIAVFRQGQGLFQKYHDDREIISTTHISVPTGQKFHPSFLLVTNRGPATACALSDIGFLAAAFLDGSLFVVDMRGPKIILRNLPEQGANKRRSFLHRSEVDPVRELTWTIAGTDSDQKPRVLLLAIHMSGSTVIYPLSRLSDGTWSVSDQTEHTDSTSHPLPDASFVIDSKTGRRCKADGNRLKEALSLTPESAEKGRYLWVTAGEKGAKCVVDITGDRIGRVDWPSKAGKVERVSVIQKNASTVLVAHTDKREALVYSLPFLEHMHGLQLPKSSQEPLSVDETGDYIEWCRHPSGSIKAEKYGTLFNVRRSGPYQAADVDFLFGRRTVTAQPQPVGIGPPTMLNSIWGYINNASMTGAQIDALLAGPDRPPPKAKLQRPAMPERGSGEGEASTSSISGVGTSAQNIANSAAGGVGNLYSRLNNALAERGEMLGSLEDSFNSLESGSKNMLAQAKTLAAKQTAKRWFQFS